MYGNYPHLGKRFLQSLDTYTPSELFTLRIGLNAVCHETMRLVEDYKQQRPETLILESKENLGKAPMMRRLFHETPIETPWTLWFDDDSHPIRSDWLTSLAMQIAYRPEISMFGKKCLLNADDEALELIRAADWYQNRPWLERDQVPYFDFVTGGYWAIRTAVIHQLDWPDRRLVHYVDDYAMGEALRQNGHQLYQCYGGVRVDNHHRRGGPPNAWTAEG